MADTIRCSRCSQHLPPSAFRPSQRSDGRYCTSCNREYCLRYFALGGPPPKPAKTCAWCGEEWKPRYPSRATFCSARCKYKSRNAAIAAVTLAAKAWGPVRRCPQCDGELPPSMRIEAVFCSVRCNEAAHALQRKLRNRTGADGGKTGYIRAAVFNRDRWRCGICKRAVSRAKTFPDPLSGSLDHVLPVCEGGTNDLANLRLVHLRCNVSRRNRGGNEQLALI